MRKNKGLHRTITISEAKQMFPEYRYAICGIKSGRPLCLYDDLQSAKEKIKSIWKFGGPACYIYDLWYEREIMA